MGALGALESPEDARLGEELTELRFAELPLEKLTRARIDEVDSPLLEALVELTDGIGFAALLAAAAARRE